MDGEYYAKKIWNILDKEEIFDALDDGMSPEEAVDHFSDQGLEISLEAVYILQSQQGNEYRTLTDEKMD